MNSLRIRYDPHSDVVFIEDMKYAADLFRGLGSFINKGRWFQLVDREDGVLTVRVAFDGFRPRPEPLSKVSLELHNRILTEALQKIESGDPDPVSIAKSTLDAPVSV